ncbi:MAG: cytochrome c oxidase subunit II [Actinomycetota bacterium]
MQASLAKRSGIVRSLAGLAALLMTGCAKQGISPTSKDVHQLYLVIMALALPVFIAVEALLIWCIVRYRKRDDSQPTQSVGGNRSLVVFFTIPAVIVAILFPFGEQTLMKLQTQTAPQVRIKVEGFQWEWTFLYLSEGIFVSGQTASADTPQTPAIMELPVGAPVEIELTSRDVIHSFFVPDLLFKRDAIPGRTSTFQFTPTTIGTFRAQCAEFCGLWHSKMTFEVHVVSAVDYQAWILQQRKEAKSVTCDPNGTDLSLVAHDISWNQYCLAVPANTAFTVSIENQDLGIEHNFSIYDSFFEETTYFKAPKITGVSSETVDVGGLPPGHYYFQCDVHGPAMSGAFIVAPP